jgi:hypothetical protein
MREFPPLDRSAEDAALQTLFFRDSEFEGRTCRVSVANYLAFLSLRGSEIKEEISKLRGALAEPAPAHLERDLATLLRARNWRFHNIACVAMACVQPSESLLAELWACVRAGSWTSPQLSATAAFIDPRFSQKALSLIEDSATYYKSIISLAALLPAGGDPLPSDAAQANVREATSIDRDNSGNIAVSWHANLVAAFSAA